MKELLVGAAVSPEGVPSLRHFRHSFVTRVSRCGNQVQSGHRFISSPTQRG
jgi:hypothetical protein